MLSSRQEQILCKVVDDYLRTGQPVASHTIAADPDLDCGPSTVRNELALLEEHGLLAHPHTSAGRVPTDAGYRYFVDRLLPERRRRPLPLSLVRTEIDRRDQFVTDVKPDVHVLGLRETPDEQRRQDQRTQRERDLCHHETAAHAEPSGAARGRLRAIRNRTHGEPVRGL